MLGFRRAPHLAHTPIGHVLPEEEFTSVGMSVLAKEASDMSKVHGNLIPLAMAARLVDEARADGSSSRSWVYRRGREHCVRIGSRKFVRRADLTKVFGEVVAEIIGEA